MDEVPDSGGPSKSAAPWWWAGGVAIVVAVVSVTVPVLLARSEGSDDDAALGNEAPLYCVQDVTPLNLRSRPRLDEENVVADIPTNACDVADAVSGGRTHVDPEGREWRNVVWGGNDGWVVKSKLLPAN